MLIVKKKYMYIQAYFISIPHSVINVLLYEDTYEVIKI